MKKRYKMSKKGSRRKYKKGNKVSKMNLSIRSQRGGGRL